MTHDLTRRGLVVGTVAALVATTLAAPDAAAHAPALPELAQTFTAGPDVAPPIVTRDGYAVHTFGWPVDTRDAAMTDRFGPRASPCSGCSTLHKGLDFNPGDGYPIRAAAPGVVVEVGRPPAGFGNYAVIAHDIRGERFATLYAHMAAAPLVSVGQTVTLGQQLGSIGTTGQSTGPHLHFEVHVNGEPVDPLPWLYAHAD